MFARVVTALCHGAFFGIGSVVAANLVPANKRASAVALMFTGLTLANVLGVPLGTALGQEAGWRSTFWAVTVIGVIALIGLIRFLPAKRDEEKLDMRAELAALKGAGIWLSLSMTALFAASMFTLFTYVAPLLGDVTGVSPKGVTWTLLLIGLGLTVGNIIGGKLADKRLAATLIGVFISMAVVSTALTWTSVARDPDRNHPVPLGHRLVRRRAGVADQRGDLRQGRAEPGVHLEHRRLQHRQRPRRLGRRQRDRPRFRPDQRAPGRRGPGDPGAAGDPDHFPSERRCRPGPCDQLINFKEKGVIP